MVDPTGRNKFQEKFLIFVWETHVNVVTLRHSDLL